MDLGYFLGRGNGTFDERWGNASQQDYFHVHPSIAIPYLVIICCATVMGTIGNIMVIGAVLINKELRIIGNIFIVNLAFADLCVTAFVDPMAIMGITSGPSWFEERPILCELIASICLTSCFCSLLSIGAIAVNRYIQICHPQNYHVIFTLRNTLLMCVALWVVCFLAESPNFFGWGDHVYDLKTLSCVWDRTADLSYTLFFVSFGVVTPVIVIFVFYVKIFVFVRASKKRVQKSPKIVGGEKNKDYLKLARTLFIIFVVFAVCWTPYALIVAIDYRDVYPQELHIFSILLAHTNSSLNSILYGIMNRHFRQGYARILGIAWCKRKYRKMRGEVAPGDGSFSTNTAINTVTENVPSPPTRAETLSVQPSPSDISISRNGSNQKLVE